VGQAARGKVDERRSKGRQGAGNPIVVGLMLSASTAAGQGIVVLKYDPAGKLLWQDIFPLTFGGAVRPSTDTSGNVYVLGSASGSGSGSTSGSGSGTASGSGRANTCGRPI